MFGGIFIGRNGPDHLSFALLITAMVLSFIPWWPYIFIICIALTLLAGGLALWRLVRGPVRRWGASRAVPPNFAVASRPRPS